MIHLLLLNQIISKSLTVFTGWPLCQTQVVRVGVRAGGCQVEPIEIVIEPVVPTRVAFDSETDSQLRKVGGIPANHFQAAVNWRPWGIRASEICDRESLLGATVKNMINVHSQVKLPISVAFPESVTFHSLFDWQVTSMVG